jgi:hypothetical protein
MEVGCGVGNAVVGFKVGKGLVNVGAWEGEAVGAWVRCTKKESELMRWE